MEEKHLIVKNRLISNGSHLMILLIAILCVRNYPITQEKQEKIRKEIEVHKRQLQVKGLYIFSL